MKRSILTAGWCSPSAAVRRSGRRFKDSSGRGIGFVPDSSRRFFVHGKDYLFIWKFVKNRGIILMLGVSDKWNLCGKQKN